MQEAHTTDQPIAPPLKRGLGKVIGALVATLVVVGLLLVHVWSRYRVVTLGYELSGLTTEREQLLEENRRLRIELRVLTRTDRLEPLARRQLGLITPRADQILFVRASELPIPSFPALDYPLAPASGASDSDMASSPIAARDPNHE